MTTQKPDELSQQMRDALDTMGIGSTEIDQLVRLIAGAIVSGETDLLAKVAGMQAGLSLVTILLNDFHRIADAQEILAKHAIDNKKLFGRGSDYQGAA